MGGAYGERDVVGVLMLRYFIKGYFLPVPVLWRHVRGAVDASHICTRVLAV